VVGAEEEEAGEEISELVMLRSMEGGREVCRIGILLHVGGVHRLHFGYNITNLLEEMYA
jgi:hypothetical protein